MSRNVPEVELSPRRGYKRVAVLGERAAFRELGFCLERQEILVFGSQHRRAVEREERLAFLHRPADEVHEHMLYVPLYLDVGLAHAGRVNLNAADGANGPGAASSAVTTEYGTWRAPMRMALAR